jgi:hypothetical protein
MKLKTRAEQTVQMMAGAPRASGLALSWLWLAGMVENFTGRIGGGDRF